MLFKDEARMQARHSKLSHSEAANWIAARVILMPKAISCIPHKLRIERS